ncbi:MAG TPA: hypothetical protein VKV40_11115 [Ktedonobacteraceae bacterium]|nr:hypothetical protein [Ktedonobacteraceae bacterium]
MDAVLKDWDDLLDMVLASENEVMDAALVYAVLLSTTRQNRRKKASSRS